MSDGDMDDMDNVEEELIRVARRAIMAATPTVDVAKIVRALPPTPARGGRVQPARARSWRTSWTGWQMAAAVSVIAVGGSSIALWPRSMSEVEIPVARVTSTPSMDSGVTPVGAGLRPARAAAPVAVGAGLRPARASAPVEEGLGVGGGLSDLDEKDLKAVLSSMDSLDDRPSAEPEPAAASLHRASNELDEGGGA